MMLVNGGWSAVTRVKGQRKHWHTYDTHRHGHGGEGGGLAVEEEDEGACACVMIGANAYLPAHYQVRHGTNFHTYK